MLICFVILYLTPSIFGLYNHHLWSHIYHENGSGTSAVSRYASKSFWSKSGRENEEKARRNLYGSSSNYIEPGAVRLAVIAPSDPNHETPLGKILPSISLAVRDVADPVRGNLPGWDIQVDYRDSNCSSAFGALAAVEFYINRSVGN